MMKFILCKNSRHIQQELIYALLEMEIKLCFSLSVRSRILNVQFIAELPQFLKAPSRRSKR